MEEWKDIKGFEGLYQVSNTGKIRSMRYLNSKRVVELKLKINKQGNVEVGLSKDNKPKYKMVSRLVYETFNNIELTNKEYVVHKDRNSLNCSIDNLQAMTKSERQRIAYIENKRPLKKYEYYGKELTINEMAIMNGTSYDTTRNRLQRLKWNSYEAIEIPVSNNNSRKEKLKNGKS